MLGYQQTTEARHGIESGDKHGFASASTQDNRLGVLCESIQDVDAIGYPDPNYQDQAHDIHGVEGHP